MSKLLGMHYGMMFAFIGLSELILGLRPANEGWRYFETASHIDWAQA